MLIFGIAPSLYFTVLQDAYRDSRLKGAAEPLISSVLSRYKASRPAAPSGPPRQLQHQMPAAWIASAPAPVYN